MRPLNFDEWDLVFVFHAIPAGDLPKDPAEPDAEVGPDEGPGEGEDGVAGVVKDPDQGNPIPDSYQLSANYPNPFNPATRMQFGLPIAIGVKLDVYNVVGQKETTLVDEFLPAGYREIEWDAADMPSGVYFYRLQTADYTESHKMILLKQDIPVPHPNHASPVPVKGAGLVLWRGVGGCAMTTRGVYCGSKEETNSRGRAYRQKYGTPGSRCPTLLR